MESISVELLDTLLEKNTSVIGRDLKLNLTRLFQSGALSNEEAMLATLAISTSVEYAELANYSRQQLLTMGLTEEQIREAAESAALMGMLNTYYRFRHFIGSSEEYRVAGLRMNVLAKPALGREHFEMLAFAVSVINGCESCVRSHEKALRDAGTPSEKIHDLARLASVIKGLKTLSGID
jgi:alkyl hydroperoxide reductase subunit D